MNKSAVKKKSIIRFEAIVPFVLVVGATVLYFTLFFDHHLRKGIEWVGGYVNGAEVNVSSLNTSFRDASFIMKGLELTDVEQPTRNKLVLGEVRLQLLWDALLRAKFVVQDASILNIQLNSPRKRAGRVYKKAEPAKETASESQVQHLATESLSKAEEKFKGNALGDIASLLGGQDPTAKLKDIQAQLTSVAKATGLQQELTEKQKLWEERLKTLPDNKVVEDLKKRVQAVEIPKDLKDLNKVKEAAEKIQAIVKDADAQVKQIQETATSLNGDLQQFQTAIKGLDEAARQDLQDIETRVQLPKLDAKEIAKSIFGQMLFSKLGQVQRYANMAREYLPAKKTEKETSTIEPPTRSAGRTYQFGRPNSYPLFWLKHSGISSKASPDSPLTGDLSGDLTDLTTDPPLIGKPLVLKIAGDFPSQEVKGLKAEVVVDHTTDVPSEKLTASVASFAVAGQSLADSEQLKLGFAKALGTSSLNAQLKNQQIALNIENAFTDVAYDLKAQNQAAEQAILAILKEIPRVTLNASAQGTWSDLKLDMNSNLGDELRKGFERQLQAKIAEARAQIQSVIDKNLKGKKEELQAQFNKVQAQVKGSVDEKKAKVDDAKKVADGRTKEAENAGKNQLQEAGKKGLEDLKKRFGF